jgi:predicted nucleic acid-binding protein
MRLYLDNSVLNRPGDDQRQARIWMETLAFSLILGLIESGQAEMIRSVIHDLENSQSPDPVRRQWVDTCLSLATIRQDLDDLLKQSALALERAGVKPLDALHLASAERADADYFLTCDDRLIKRYKGSLAILTPLDFINRELKLS